MPFPKDFVWGAATASYQVEGAALEDGRGECIWTRFSHTPGKVLNGDTGDVACDHYHRYKDDVKLMQDLGLKAYRLSVSWPRVLPTGTGATNPAGLDFYDHLIDALLEAGITPYVTLYHWDLPQALQDRGGWTNPQIVDWFAEYTDVISRKLGDRVQNWMTHNEPFVVAFVGNYFGRHAPGLQDFPTALRAAHHLPLAHGAAVPVLRRNVPGAKVGIVFNYAQSEPYGDTPEDMQAARYHDGFVNRWFFDPVLTGSYPADMVELFKAGLDGIDLDAVKAANVPLDFVGLNYYTRTLLQYDESIAWTRGKVMLPEDAELTTMNWEVYPEGIRKMLLRVHEDYQPAEIYITENGSAWPDAEPANGVLEDPRRVAYLKSHLQAIEAAVDADVPLKGYFAWSLMDNFEWGWGYSQRFGIVHINYKTQQRTWKRTAHYYKDVIKANAVV